MHDSVFFNHQILSAHEPNLSAISATTFYGKGVFTTIAIYNSQPFLWKKHWQRLMSNAAKIGVDISDFSEESTRNSLNEIITKNSCQNGRARLTFFDESASQIWSFNSKNKTSLLITTADFREISELKLTVSPFQINSTSPLVNTKSCNYLENLLALEAAKKSGFDEAIRLNERGEIVSATMANIFWIKDGQIFTPSLETGCLAGTTRGFVLENFSVKEVKISLKDLAGVEGIFLTSAGIEIAKVNQFEELNFGNLEIFSQITDKFKKFVAEK